MQSYYRNPGLSNATITLEKVRTKTNIINAMKTQFFNSLLKKKLFFVFLVDFILLCQYSVYNNLPCLLDRKTLSEGILHKLYFFILLSCSHIL